MLAEKLNMNPEEAECWIVNLIRNARLDAKIDSKLGHVVMGTQPLSPYQQVLEKIDTLSVRSEALQQLIERKVKAKTQEVNKMFLKEFFHFSLWKFKILHFNLIDTDSFNLNFFCSKIHFGTILKTLSVMVSYKKKKNVNKKRIILFTKCYFIYLFSIIIKIISKLFSDFF